MYPLKYVSLLGNYYLNRREYIVFSSDEAINRVQMTFYRLNCRSEGGILCPEIISVIQ
jgi:hypothetical protein